MRHFGLFITLMSIFLTSCTGGGNLSKDVETLPQTLPAASEVVADNDYLIGPLDELTITVFKEPDLSLTEVPVDTNGYLSFPLIGQIVAEGRRATEIRDEIKTKLDARYLRDAQVSVFVSKFSNFTVTIDGEVNKPGIFEIPGRLSLSQAVALGEGATEFAKLDEVVVLRKIEGKTYAARFDLTRIYTRSAPDLQLQRADTVIVGYSAARRRFKDILQILPGVAGVFVALIQQDGI